MSDPCSRAGKAYSSDTARQGPLALVLLDHYLEQGEQGAATQGTDVPLMREASYSGRPYRASVRGRTSHGSL